MAAWARAASSLAACSCASEARPVARPLLARLASLRLLLSGPRVGFRLHLSFFRGVSSACRCASACGFSIGFGGGRSCGRIFFSLDALRFLALGGKCAGVFGKLDGLARRW